MLSRKHAISNQVLAHVLKSIFTSKGLRPYFTTNPTFNITHKNPKAYYSYFVEAGLKWVLEKTHLETKNLRF